MIQIQSNKNHQFDNTVEFNKIENSQISDILIKLKIKVKI